MIGYIVLKNKCQYALTFEFVYSIVYKHYLFMEIQYEVEYKHRRSFEEFCIY